MAQLMGKGADIFVLIVVVQKDVRVDIIRAAIGICARAFARRGINIDPSLLKRFSDNPAVIIPQRLHGVEHKFLRLFICIFQIDSFNNRRIYIRVFQRLYCQHSFFQFQISVERIEVVGDILDKSHINFRRNVVFVQSSVQRGFVITRPGVKHILLYICIKLRAESCFELVKRAPERIKHGLPVITILHGPVAAVAGFGKLGHRAVT